MGSYKSFAITNAFLSPLFAYLAPWFTGPLWFDTLGIIICSHIVFGIFKGCEKLYLRLKK